MSFVTWMNSTAGRIARVVAGVVLIILGVIVGGAAGFVIGAVGLVPLIAGMAGVCLVAPLMHVSPRAH